MTSLHILAWLNFFVADVRDGLGPYLGVFLKGHNFLEGQIGLINTISSFCALILAVPFGILVDKTKYKRFLIGFCILMIMFSTVAIYLYPNFTFILLAQLSIALCGVCLSPAFAALTLGMVGQANYARQIGYNEAYKHAGTAFAAALSFICALYFGIASIFIIALFMGVFSIVCLILLRNTFIDHNIARGIEINQNSHYSLKQAFSNTKLLLFALIIFCFHLSNAYMLPLLSQRAYTLGVDSSGAYAAATIIIAQSTMILIAILCAKFLKTKDNVNKLNIISRLMALALFELMIRGMIAANFDGILAMILVQILDGIGAGIVGVVVPIFVAFILRGSGHINACLALVMTCGGIGGALSSSLGGFIAQYFGYFYSYLTLALVAFAGFILCLIFNVKVRL